MENTKYKIVETSGCIAFKFTVNDKSFSKLSEQEHNEMLEYLFQKIKEEIEKHTISIEDVVRLFQYNDYEIDPESCEQCGDTVCTTIWNI